MNYNDIVNSLFPNKKNKDNNTLKIIPNLFTVDDKIDCKYIHIYGEKDIGKTLFILNVIKNNPNKIFLYVDTYLKILNSNLTDNICLFRSNNIKEILDFISSINEKKMIDYVVIDSMSFLTCPEENYEDKNKRYELLNTYMKNLIQKLYQKRIGLISVNNKNGLGKPYNFSYQMKSLFQTNIELKLKNFNSKENELEVIVHNNKLGPSNFVENIIIEKA